MEDAFKPSWLKNSGQDGVQILIRNIIKHVLYIKNLKLAGQRAQMVKPNLS